MPLPHKTASIAAIAPADRSSRAALSRLDARAFVEPLWMDSEIQTSHGRIAVRIGRGRGTPVVLLHGNSSSKEVFARLMGSDLGSACRMIAIDLPGHGSSADATDPERSYSIPGYADAVIEVLEHLDLSTAALLGWSLGGHVALDVAARYPGILGVMLCGTPPVGSSVDAILAGFRPIADLGLFGQADLTPRETRTFAKLTAGRSDLAAIEAAIARTDGRARASMYAHLLGGSVPDQRAFVEAATMPIAVVNGSDDPVVNTDYLRNLRRPSLWYRRVHWIRSGGHAPFLTQPEAFDAVFARFLRSMDRRQKRAQSVPSLALSG